MTRTTPQNSAMHKGFEILSERLNDAGSTMKIVLGGKKKRLLRKILVEIQKLMVIAIDRLDQPEADVPWTQVSVKEVMFKPIIKAMYNVDSTTSLNTVQISDAWDVLLKNLTESGYCEYVPFPSIESMRQG